MTDHYLLPVGRGEGGKGERGEGGKGGRSGIESKDFVCVTILP